MVVVGRSYLSEDFFTSIGVYSSVIHRRTWYRHAYTNASICSLTYVYGQFLLLRSGGNPDGVLIYGYRYVVATWSRVRFGLWSSFHGHVCWNIYLLLAHINVSLPILVAGRGYVYVRVFREAGSWFYGEIVRGVETSQACVPNYGFFLGEVG